MARKKVLQDSRGAKSERERYGVGLLRDHLQPCSQLCACAQPLLGTREIKLYSCDLSDVSKQDAHVRCFITG